MNDQDHCALFQNFGDNATPLYAGMKLRGHPGRDTGCGYGTPVHSPVSGTVSGVFTPEKPASDGYVAVYILVQTKLETFEYCIGHLSQVHVQLGDQVKKGDLIGNEGNSGVVYVGQERITLYEQAHGDHRGSHRHNQKRPVVAQPYTGQPGVYLENENGLVHLYGSFWQWAMPNNGYNSCVDPTETLFNEDLMPAQTGYYVNLLQKALGCPQGPYGPMTIAAVQAFQTAHGIAPTGSCGPKTRAVLNSLYGGLEDPVAPQTPPPAPQAADVPQTVSQAVQEIETLPLQDQPSRLMQLITWLKSFLGISK